jgi:hypothetical protein
MGQRRPARRPWVHAATRIAAWVAAAALWTCYGHGGDGIDPFQVTIPCRGVAAFDFGDRPDRTIRVRNATHEEVSLFSTRRSCSCTGLEPRNHVTVKAGDTADFAVHVEKPRSYIQLVFRGAQSEALHQVDIDIRCRPPVPGTISAMAKDPVRVMATGLGSETVRVLNDSTEKLRIVSLTVGTRHVAEPATDRLAVGEVLPIAVEVQNTPVRVRVEVAGKRVRNTLVVIVEKPVMLPPARDAGPDTAPPSDSSAPPLAP